MALASAVGSTRFLQSLLLLGSNWGVWWRLGYPTSIIPHPLQAAERNPSVVSSRQVGQAIPAAPELEEGRDPQVTIIWTTEPLKVRLSGPLQVPYSVP